MNSMDSLLGSAQKRYVSKVGIEKFEREEI